MEQQILEGFELSPQQKEQWRVIQGAAGNEFAVSCEVRVEGVVDHAKAF